MPAAPKSALPVFTSLIIESKAISFTTKVLPKYLAISFAISTYLLLQLLHHHNIHMEQIQLL